ncbi:hypothetical protein GW17_00034017, partial [Ensete ventricosum]
MHSICVSKLQHLLRTIVIVALFEVLLLLLQSDCFYNAGWTEDIREVINHLHQEYPKAHLFAVGTSVGANILVCMQGLFVKYLGEDADNSPVAGAASICSPWDLVVSVKSESYLLMSLVFCLLCRFVTGFLLESQSNDFITEPSQWVSRIMQNCMFLLNFACKTNLVDIHKPVLARLANWEGIRKSCSVREFDSHATCLVGKFEASTHGLHSLLESSVDKGPFVNVMEDGMVAAMTSDGAHHEHKENSYDPINHDMKPEDEVDYGDQSGERTEVDADLQQSAVSLGQRVEEESYDPDVTASVT